MIAPSLKSYDALLDLLAEAIALELLEAGASANVETNEPNVLSCWENPAARTKRGPASFGERAD